ncbi:hypothetical protein TorRG33x02_250620 [Trema orientale]|uniref:Uncharacterized protein n=1 Tax=Trema orientale TaxID=63057 RepID=A0A2P5DII1_TREOI|nr:hypothetical protein TorRG33x02_250620 [Trema orientale]
MAAEEFQDLIVNLPRSVLWGCGDKDTILRNWSEESGDSDLNGLNKIEVDNGGDLVVADPIHSQVKEGKMVKGKEKGATNFSEEDTQTLGLNFKEMLTAKKCESSRRKSNPVRQSKKLSPLKLRLGPSLNGSYGDLFA